MAEGLLLTAIKTKPRKLTLSARELRALPDMVGQITSLEVLILKSNKLHDLPKDLAAIESLNTINLGRNEFKSLPAVLEFTSNLQKLHLFQNQLSKIDVTVLGGLRNLTLLNLNSNEITSLPPEINCLKKLQFLSVDNNYISEIPSSLCCLEHLEDFHIAGNLLSSLPKNFGCLKNLKKFYCQKNKLRALPESLCSCRKLKVLDLSANNLQIFPSQLLHMKLTELYCEQNSLLQHLPIHSVQDPEVFTLKELCGRFVVRAVRDSSSMMREEIRNLPEAEQICAKAGDCVVCGGPFIDTWLECVQFVDSRKVLRTKTNAGIIPVRGLLCSYKCFNSNSHNYYGIAVGKS